MVDITTVVTVGSILVAIVGGTFTIRNQLRQGKLESEKRIIEAIQKEVAPINVSMEKDRELIKADLNTKEQSIKDLWKDLEGLEDHLNILQVQVAKNTGVIDMYTPLITEIRDQIGALRGKLDLIQSGLNIKNG